MQANKVDSPKSWWAEGDLPVRSDSQVTFLVDGRHTMWTLCLHFLKASKTIYMAHWGLTPTMLLVRGSDHRAGPDNSPAQLVLLSELKAAGLSDADIQFWVNNELTVQHVLAYALSKGVTVKVLLWACPEVFSHYSPKTAHEQLVAVGVTSLLDDSADRLPHPEESLHQKLAIVDSTYAFVGGIDPLIELSGDFDRWDTPWHTLLSQLRANPKDALPHSWHDAHALIAGTAARDAELNFQQRWNDVVVHHRLPEELLVPAPLLAALAGNPIHLTQIARTIPGKTYNFAPEGIAGIAQIYANAFHNAQNIVYLENQYFWLHSFIGLEIADFGPNNPQMEQNMHLLAEALERGASMTIILPDHPNVGRSFTDIGLEHLRRKAPGAAAAGRIQAFCLATSGQRDGKEDYRPVYVHAKVAIIDDIWATIGSANLNNRGMRDDAEINVAILNPDLAHELRIMLWAEHLGLLEDDEQFIVSRYLAHQPLNPESSQRAVTIWQSLVTRLADPATGLRLLAENAQANLERFQHGTPLVGHLFPYLTAQEAHHLGLKFHESHGLFETPKQ